MHTIYLWDLELLTHYGQFCGREALGFGTRLHWGKADAGGSYRDAPSSGNHQVEGMLRYPDTAQEIYGKIMVGEACWYGMENGQHQAGSCHWSVEGGDHRDVLDFSSRDGHIQHPRVRAISEVGQTLDASQEGK